MIMLGIVGMLLGVSFGLPLVGRPCNLGKEYVLNPPIALELFFIELSSFFPSPLNL
jgi:hypothetical protein